MRLHIFFSVHNRLFGPIAERLTREHGVRRVTGFVWGLDQQAALAAEQAPVDALTVFTRDVLPQLDDQPADAAYLAAWEQRCGVPLQHMIFSERHMLQTHTYDQVARIAELTFRRVERDFDTHRPDAYFSEDVSCLVSYIHWAVAKARKVHTVFLSNARFQKRVTAYSNPLQQWDLLDAIFPETPAGALSPEDLAHADELIANFRARPVIPTGQAFRNRLRVASRFDWHRLRGAARGFAQDPKNPTLRRPEQVVANRARRLLRNAAATVTGMFEDPKPGERFVLFPLHLQPEASTLVLAPYYLNQLALVEDMAKSLPVGVRLYVKEHLVSRGRWPLSFYTALRAVPGVRLIKSTVDPFALINDAAAIAVITGTMGFEGILLDKPVITFGEIFYNVYPLVYRAGNLPKKEWPALFREVLSTRRSDPELLRRFVACAYKATHPGVTGNVSTLPAILEPENVDNLTRFVAARLSSPWRRADANTVHRHEPS